ncbi:hypothetical protein AgCh_023395 [Apium graveolens]
MSGGQVFNNISLGGRGGTNPGQLRVVHTGDIMWKKRGSGNADVEVDKADILGLTWMKVPRSNQLGVISKKGFNYNFSGFGDQFNQPHTFVVVSLDPPIHKGQTLYPHILIQFETDQIVENTLPPKEEISNKYQDKIENKGLIHEVFTTILKNLSSTKVTRPGKFQSRQDGYAVKWSLKADDGVLYPLERSFFFLPKPPTLIFHDMIDYVEFEMHAAGRSNMQYFDLLIRLKTEQEYLFRNIQRNEYHNLFDFISSKGLKIMNVGGSQAADCVPTVLQNDDGDVDPHLERIKNDADGDESDEEDEDFVAEKDDSGSPTDDSDGEDSDASDNGGENERLAKKEPEKKPLAFPKEAASKKRTRTKDGEEDGVKKNKPKKKEPNAPKKPLSAFMFFSKAERENVKKTNPGISFTDTGRVLGERWNKISGEEKEVYEASARQDKKRYTDEMKGYTKD